MLNFKVVLGGLGIGAVIILSSIPLVRYEESDADYCSATHKVDESGCKKDGDHHCVWCVSRAVPSSCYDEETARKLPHSVFRCEFQYDEQGSVVEQIS